MTRKLFISVCLSFFCISIAAAALEPICISADGEHFVLKDSGKRFTPWGYNYLGEFGGNGKGPGQFNGVHSVAVGPNDRIYALDRSGGRINVFRATPDPKKVEFVAAWPGFSLPLDLIVNDNAVWMTDLKPLRFVKLDFQGNRLYTWLVPPDLPDGYLEVHTFSVDSEGNLYGGDNQYGRTQKFVPRPGADAALLIKSPWRAAGVH